MRTVVGVIFRNRDMILSFVWRDIQQRYQGSFLGLVWSVINPIVMLAVYTFVFGMIFKAKWGGIEDTYLFAIGLYASLLAFNVFSEVLSRSPGLILGNASYVTKIIFPVEVFPVVLVFSALFNYVVGLVVWLIAYLIIFGLPPLTVLLVPIVFFPLFLILMGLAWIVSAIGVYVRDIAQLINMLISCAMFITPIFYPVSIIPEEYRGLMQLNPLAIIIDNLKTVMIMGQMIKWPDYLIELTLASLLCFAGLSLFIKLKKGFGDVI